MRAKLRSGLDRVLTAPIAASLMRPFQHGVGAVFMLHRFADPDLGVGGHDPELISRAIRFLRSRGFRIRDALELITAAMRGEDISRSVAFTVDDGYVDFATVGAPLFRRYGAPVTLFVPTDLAGGRSWLWWDRVTAGMAATGRWTVDVPLDGRVLPLSIADPESRTASAERLIAQLKSLPRSRIDEIVQRLLADLDVELPEEPPRRYSILDWDALRAEAGNGIHLGPHTATHSILSRVTPERAEEEIADSWRRLKQEVPEATVPLFCYPNGKQGDFSCEHFEMLARCGLEAAVTAETGYVVRAGGIRAPVQRFAIPRFAMPWHLREFKSIVLGVERLVVSAKQWAGRGMH